MHRKTAAAALLVSVSLSGQAFAGAFEVKTSQGTLPKQESKRPLSLPRQLLKIELIEGYNHQLVGFNNEGDNGCDPIFNPGCAGQTPSFLMIVPGGDPSQGSLGHNFINTSITNLNVGYGLTENLSVGFLAPFIVARENYIANANEFVAPIENLKASGALPVRKANQLGDMNFLIQYQFLRTYEGPMRSLVGRINMRLPTGNESPGDQNKLVPGDDPETPQVELNHIQDVRTLITGTGTTDADLGISYKQEVANGFSVTASTGYVVRFPAIVGYMFNEAGIQFADGLQGSAKLDLGDQVYGNLRVTISPSEKWYATLDGRIKRWGSTRVARPAILAGQEVATGEQTTETQDVFVGGRYLDIPDSAGYLVTAIPRAVYQPTDWLEVGVDVDLHLLGKNTNYVRGNEVTNGLTTGGDQPFGQVGAEENNFFILEALGQPLGPMILGTARLGLTFKY